MINDARTRALFTLQKEKEALLNLEQGIPTSFDAVVKLLLERKGKIIITGVGKSGFVGMKIAATFVSLGHPALFLHPVEALHGDAGIVADGDIIIAISFSGESQEIIKIIKYLKKSFATSIIAITGKESSSLAQMAHTSLVLKVTHEGDPLGLAPMASTTTTLVMGDMLASAITSPDVFEKFHFAKFHPGGNLGLKLIKVKVAMVQGDKVSKINSTDLLSVALREMTETKFGITSVIDAHGTIVGVVTDGDIRRFLLTHTSIEGVLVKDVMTTHPKVVSPEASLVEALSLMEEYKITSLFVTDEENKLIGLLHLHDVIENNIL